ncbi:MAG: mechanosensitive ion channel domain-containing protein [Woeseiaceae bacterium]
MNDIQLSDFGIDWTTWSEKLQTAGLDFALNLIAAIAIFYIGRTIARLISNGLHRLMIAQSVDPILESFVSNIVYWAMMAFVIIAAITKIGVQTASLIALIGAAGIAVGLAMQGSLANFAAGVLIVIFRPYRSGDWVEVAGVSGSVVQVQILSTILTSGDNKKIIVPNGQIMNGIITNYSANATRRVDLVVSVGYDDDLDKVRSTLKELVDADARILDEPECQIAIDALAASSVDCVVRPWVRTEDYWPVKFDLTEAIKKRFDEVSISFPYPQQVVHNIDAKAVKRRAPAG